jgi:hypothetical protein
LTPTDIVEFFSRLYLRRKSDYESLFTAKLGGDDSRGRQLAFIREFVKVVGDAKVLGSCYFEGTYAKLVSCDDKTKCLACTSISYEKACEEGARHGMEAAARTRERRGAKRAREKA